MPVQVTLASTHDRSGGAAVAASRLRDGLLAQGIGVRMLVQTQSEPHPATVSARNGVQRFLNRVRSDVDGLPVRRYGTATEQFSASWLPRRWPSFADAGPCDLVHLHWTNAGFLSVRDIARISVPVVWTLHDMWALTGGCQYDGNCGRFAQGCGKCPVLGSTSAADLSASRFASKRREWQSLDLTVVSPSHWLADEARRSAILRDKRIEVIRNGLDVQRFKPLDRAFAREALGLPLDRRLILFGAVNAGADRRKGYDLLEEAIAALSTLPNASDQMTLVVFGSAPAREETVHGMRALHIGRLHDDVALALLYAACDVFVAPSRQENLPNTVAEAMACGTPCVGFDIGGMRDLIEHCGNGYLARPFDVADLAHGIAWTLEIAEGRWQALCANARRFAIAQLDLVKQTTRHVALYQESISGAGKRHD